MVAPQAMRTVWLALLCLIGLATILIVKMAGSSTDVAKAVPSTNAAVLREAALSDAMGILSENLMARAKLKNSPFTINDKLEVEAAPELKPVKSVAIVLPTGEPKQLSKTTERMVIRHWHDPLDKRTAAAQPTAKGKLSKRARSAEASIATSIEMPSREP
jgi:hypothetical protein